MEYGINFNNDDTILTALEDLNSTFFTEYSDSEDEKESSIISNNNDDDNDDEIISDFDNNFDLNNFEFKEVSDNYVEDKIYDDLKLKVKEFFKKGSVHVILINPVL